MFFSATKIRRTIIFLLCGIGALAGMPALAERPKIALTFDDLPSLTILADQSYVTWTNDALLRGLRRHHLPATGFVNQGKVDELDRARQTAILEAWLKAGMDLGNHTFSHESPNVLGAAGYIRDIERGEPLTRALLARHHKRMRWFRHPYLETGTPASAKREIDNWLAGHGYRIAPVTVDANDWQFAEPYDDAVARHDEPRRKQIMVEYLRYTEKVLAWARTASHALFGRDIAYVMLLHDTRLNADSLDDLARLLRDGKWRAVSLDQAMEDPAYRTPDTYAGPDGIDWLERWSDSLHRDLPWATYSDPPADIQNAYDRVDQDRSRPTAVQ